VPSWPNSLETRVTGHCHDCPAGLDQARHCAQRTEFARELHYIGEAGRPSPVDARTDVLAVALVLSQRRVGSIQGTPSDPDASFLARLRALNPAVSLSTFPGKWMLALTCPDPLKELSHERYSSPSH
jgi:hypothetical protein